MTLRGILLFILAIATVVHADPTGILTRPVPIPEHPAYFLHANESHNYLQYDVARAASFDRPTAAIVVGTLRAFNLAGVLRRDLLIALDYSANTGRFNEALAEMIVKMNRVDFVNMLRRADDTPARRESSDRLTRLLTEFGASNPQIDNWDLGIRAYLANENTLRGTFFGDDESYEHVRKLIRDKRFFTITADLGGRGVFPQISTFLKRKGYVVSELDISNSLDYLGDAHGAQDPMLNLIDNMQALPVVEDSRVLITFQAHYVNRFREKFAGVIKIENIPAGNGWVFPAPTFGQFIDNANSNLTEFYDRLIRELFIPCEARIS